MDEIIRKIKFTLVDKATYVIGCANITDEVFKHEVCHALYYTDKNYKKQMDNLTEGLPKKYYDVFKNNILKMGYAAKVVDDEIQAYLQYGYNENQFGRGVDIRVRKEYSDIYKSAANK